MPAQRSRGPLPLQSVTMNASGLYTAPAAVTTQQTLTVWATSVADTSRSAVAYITLNRGAALVLYACFSK